MSTRDLPFSSIIVHRPSPKSEAQEAQTKPGDSDSPASTTSASVSSTTGDCQSTSSKSSSPSSGALVIRRPRPVGRSSLVVSKTSTSRTRRDGVRPRKPRESGPTAAEWESHQGTIKRLYIDEGKKLSEVMEIMKTEHGFSGTVKMYKTRLTQWGLVKYNREADVRHIVSLLAERDRVGKGSEIIVSDRVLDLQRIKTYLQRKHLTIEDLLGQASSSSSTSSSPSPSTSRSNTSFTINTAAINPSDYIRFRTPSPPLVLRDHHVNSERVLASSRRYVQTIYDPSSWNDDAVAQRHIVSSTLGDMFALMLTANSLLRVKQYSAGGELVRRASVRLEQLVCMAHPRAVPLYTFFVLMDLNIHFQSMARSLCQHMAHLANVYVNSPLHPLRELLSHLAQSETSEDLMRNLVEGWKYYLLSFNRRYKINKSSNSTCDEYIEDGDENHDIFASIDPFLEYQRKSTTANSAATDKNGSLNFLAGPEGITWWLDVLTCGGWQMSTATLHSYFDKFALAGHLQEIVGSNISTAMLVWADFEYCKIIRQDQSILNTSRPLMKYQAKYLPADIADKPIVREIITFNYDWITAHTDYFLAVERFKNAHGKLLGCFGAEQLARAQSHGSQLVELLKEWGEPEKAVEVAEWLFEIQHAEGRLTGGKDVRVIVTASHQPFLQ